MTEQKLSCISCKKRVTGGIGGVRFNCPNCGKYEIVRCKSCREIAAKYKCPECGFIGPN